MCLVTSKHKGMSSKKNLKSVIKKIYFLLNNKYPETPCRLNHTDCFQLLLATMLSAQSTDEQVNLITENLFKNYEDPKALAYADFKDVERIIKSVGLFRNKARNLIKCSKMIYEDFGGQVPEKLNDLIELPGVGRKTANVIIGYWFQKPAVIVDTHFLRVITRLGLSESKHPDKVEYDIGGLLSSKSWTRFSNSVNYHGRFCCHARLPNCNSCVLLGNCTYSNKNII